VFILIINKENTVMETETKTEGVVDTKNNEGEGTEPKEDVVSISKKDYETLNQTLGSLKRELKDLKKSKEEPETPQTKPDESVLQRVERMALRQAGLTHQDDIELAKTTAKKWGMDIEDVVADEDFKAKLERLQTSRSNVEATDVKGGQGTSQAKNTPEYWIAKGTPPSVTDVPDRKTRAKIARAMMFNATTGGKKFYND
jgi:hypothetical protein